jgi:hypothetical protein
MYLRNELPFSVSHAEHPSVNPYDSARDEASFLAEEKGNDLCYLYRLCATTKRRYIDTRPNEILAGVKTVPGAMAFTLIALEPNSRAVTAVSVFKPPFAALYSETPALPINPDIDEMFTIADPALR